MARISRTLFNTVANDLNLDGEQRAAYLSESNGMFRVYRYPICPDPSNYLGMEAHTDSSVLTILNEDDVGGLQVLHENAWFNVVPVPGTLIVNLGDLMQVSLHLWFLVLFKLNCKYQIFNVRKNFWHRKYFAVYI